MSREKEFNTKYSPEFKIAVIIDMRNNRLGYRETMRKYFSHLEEGNFAFLKVWERIYLEEGEIGLMTERRGRKSTGRPRKKPLDKEIENDLIAENQASRLYLLLQQRENFSQTKRNESCTIQNSLPNYLINFFSNLWGSLQISKPALSLLFHHNLFQRYFIQLKGKRPYNRLIEENES